jgi:hypothetical protein
MSRLRPSLSVVAVAGASIALVACGGGSSGSSGSATNASTAPNGANGTQSAAFQKFQDCLKDNGVTLPARGRRPGGGNGNGYGPPPTSTGGTPPTGTNGAPPAGGFRGGGLPSDPKFQKAMQACAKYRPQGGRGGYGGGRPQQDIKAFTPYLTCLKDKGLDVKLADGFNALRGLKQDDPKVQAALKSCRPKLPHRQPQQSAGTSTTGTT